MQPSARELMDSFTTGFGIGLTLYDEHFTELYHAGEHTAYCAALHRSAACLDACIRSDKVAIAEVKRTREPLVYTCPFGLYEALFPIFAGKRLLGFLFVGPAAEGDLAALFRTALARSEELSRATLEEAASTLPRLSKEHLRAAEQLLSVLVDHLAAGRMPAAAGLSRGEQICDYIGRHLSEKITLAALCRHLHCSTVTLTESFRREYGMSVMDFVLAERIKRAKQLLADPAYGVADVGERCGFSDAGYFSRCFKRQTGISPSAWRERKK